MGDAQRKLLASAEAIKLDLSGLGLHIIRGDRLNLERDPETGEAQPERVAPRAFALLARTAVRAAYPQGLDRRDGKIWAAWEDVLEDEAPVVEVTRGQLDWLWRRLNDDAVRLPVGMAQWREAAADGIDALLRPAAESPAA